jgi:hypothetical protein
MVSRFTEMGFERRLELGPFGYRLGDDGELVPPEAEQAMGEAVETSNSQSR